MKDTDSQNAKLAGTKRALERSQISIEQLATSSDLVVSLMDKLAEGVEAVTEKFYKLSGDDMPEHLKAAAEARKAASEELKLKKELAAAEKKDKKMAEEGKGDWNLSKSFNQQYMESLREKLETATKEKEKAYEKKKQEDIKAGIVVGGATTTTTSAEAPGAAGAAAPTAKSAAPTQLNYEPTVVDTDKSGDKAAGATGKEKGVKPEVLGKLAQVESSIGKKLVITSGFRPGTPNHGSGDAVDLGFGSNKLSTEEINKVFSSAIAAGFTGIGAEFKAPGGAHIHLDTSHSTLTGWGSDYRSASLPKDSPYLAQLINDKRNGKATGAGNTARTGGIFDGPDSGYLTELHGDEIIQPVGKEALNTSMIGGVGGGEDSADFKVVYKEMASKLDALISVMNDNMKANKKQSQAKFV